MKIILDTDVIVKPIVYLPILIKKGLNKYAYFANTNVIFTFAVIPIIVLITMVLMYAAWYQDPDRHPFVIPQIYMKILFIVASVVNLFSLYAYGKHIFVFLFKKESYKQYIEDINIIFNPPPPEGTEIKVEYVYSDKKPVKIGEFK